MSLDPSGAFPGPPPEDRAGLRPNRPDGASDAYAPGPASLQRAPGQKLFVRPPREILKRGIIAGTMVGAAFLSILAGAVALILFMDAGTLREAFEELQNFLEYAPMIALVAVSALGSGAALGAFAACLQRLRFLYAGLVGIAVYVFNACMTGAAVLWADGGASEAGALEAALSFIGGSLALGIIGSVLFSPIALTLLAAGVGLLLYYTRRPPEKSAPEADASAEKSA